MARRRRGRFGALMVKATLGIGFAIGVVAAGVLLLGERVVPPLAETAVAPVPPAPPPPPPPQPVGRLSEVAVAGPLTFAHLFAPSGELADPLLDAAAAARDCDAFRRATDPGRRVALREAVRPLLVEPRPTRLQTQISLYPGPNGAAPDLPETASGASLRLSVALPTPCQTIWQAAGLPTTVLLRIEGKAPWPPVASAADARAADLVVEIVSLDLAAAPEPATLRVRPIALYLWDGPGRGRPLGALGHAAPDSQDRVIVAPTASPTEPTPQPGRPVTGEIGRRFAPTPGAPLPPISASPRAPVDVAPLPPALGRGP